MMGKQKSTSASLSLFGDSSPELTAPTPKRRNRKAIGLPPGLPLDKYEKDEEGRLREIVGACVRDKHAILQNYVGIASAVRNKWVARGPAGTTYIDLFSGPGRVRIKDTDDVLFGSPLLAWTYSQQRSAAFTNIYVADAHPSLVEDCRVRLEAEAAPVEFETGRAVDTVDRIIGRLNKYSYHFAFLDPFSLGALSFGVIQKLAKLQHIDILIHVSVQDLNRNLRKYINKEGASLDIFAPGWRDSVDINRSDQHVRAKIFEYWGNLLKTIGLPVAEATELISGEKNQPLYWLAFAARNKLAHAFWDKIRRVQPDVQKQLISG